MNNLIIIVYTTIGGIVGAAATQYVTHIRDRRAARALVIEHVGKVEAAFSALKVTFSPDTGDVNPLPQMDEFLAPLEAAGLIAGVPYDFLRLYINSVRVNYELRRMEAIADGLAIRVVKAVPAILQEDSSLDPAKVRRDVQQAIKMASEVRDLAGDRRAEKARQSALSLLKTAIWHPLAIRLAKKRISSSLKAFLDKVDESREMLTDLNKRLEGKADVTSYISRRLSIMDEPPASNGV